MKIDKDYMYFKRWFKEIEYSIYCGQWSDENIAYSAFREGMKRAQCPGLKPEKPLDEDIIDWAKKDSANKKLQELTKDLLTIGKIEGAKALRDGKIPTIKE